MSDSDPRDLAEHIQRLRQALRNEKNLRSQLDDMFLLKFLRARKFDHDRALALIKNYYKQRIKYPEFYRTMHCNSLPQAFASTTMGKFPYLDPKGRTIFFLSGLDTWDPRTFPFMEILAFGLLAFELAIEDDAAQENGILLLVNAAEFGFRHLRAFDPFTIAQAISVTMNSFPVKFKGFHIINAPKYFRILFSLAKPFMTKKIRSRFIFHDSDLSDLHRELPREIITEEFGGLLERLDYTEWHATLRDRDAARERDRVYGYVDD